MKDKIKVGQTIYTLPVGNRARNSANRLTPEVVTRIGRKYFYFKKYGGEVKISFEWMDDRGEYSANTEVYLSEKCWEDKKLTEKLVRRLSYTFNSCGSNPKGWELEKLKKVINILDIDLD